MAQVDQPYSPSGNVVGIGAFEDADELSNKAKLMVLNGKKSNF